MATPVKKITPADETIIKELYGILQYVSEDDHDEIGIRRVAFIASLLDKADDDLLLWTQGSTATTPDVAARIATNLRKEMDIAIAGAITTLTSELQHNQNKIGGRMLNVIHLINADSDLRDQLSQVLPQERNAEELDTAELNAVIKVSECLSHAKAVPTRVNGKLNSTRGYEEFWKIEHGDGIYIYVPVGHPGVSHLENLHKEGTPLTLTNIFQDVPTEPRKRSSSDADLDDPLTPSTRTTRNQTIYLQMEKSRDDKVRNIKPKIKERQLYLKRILPAMPDELIKLRSLGWAKYEIENRNRFQPQEKRLQVTESAWELLFGAQEYNLSTADLCNVDVHYQRYKEHAKGYDILLKLDGRQS